MANDIDSTYAHERDLLVGAGPLAPLSHLSIHAFDIRGPLDIETPTTTSATARLVLDDITQGKHAVSKNLLQNAATLALVAVLRHEGVEFGYHGVGGGRWSGGPRPLGGVLWLPSLRGEPGQPMQTHRFGSVKNW